MHDRLVREPRRLYQVLKSINIEERMSEEVPLPIEEEPEGGDSTESEQEAMEETPPRRVRKKKKKEITAHAQGAEQILGQSERKLSDEVLLEAFSLGSVARVRELLGDEEFAKMRKALQYVGRYKEARLKKAAERRESSPVLPDPSSVGQQSSPILHEIQIEGEGLGMESESIESGNEHGQGSPRMATNPFSQGSPRKDISVLRAPRSSLTVRNQPAETIRGYYEEQVPRRKRPQSAAPFMERKQQSFGRQDPPK